MVSGKVLHITQSPTAMLGFQLEFAIGHQLCWGTAVSFLVYWAVCSPGTRYQRDLLWLIKPQGWISVEGRAMFEVQRMHIWPQLSILPFGDVPTQGERGQTCSLALGDH